MVSNQSAAGYKELGGPGAEEGGCCRKAATGFTDSVARFCCARFDVWYMMNTFTYTRFEGHAELTAKVDLEVKKIHEIYGVDGYHDYYLACPFKLYLTTVLAPSLWLAESYPCYCGFAVLWASAFFIYYSVIGIANLRDYPEDLGTWQLIEHSPLVPVVLLLCTHGIMVIFSWKVLQCLRKKDSNLPFPLTYPTVIGKFFMLLRMAMAYSSANLAISLDYFIWQELILITFHSTVSLVVGSAHDGMGKADYKSQLRKVFVRIFAMDAAKTLIMLVYWKTFAPGVIRTIIDRVPYVMSQICLSVTIHAILDLIQCAASMFTMFIARCGEKVFCNHTGA